MHPKTFQPHARKRRNPDRARWLRRIAAHLAAHLAAHVRNDGVAVAWAFLLRTLIAPWRRPARDPGERAAERFLRALNYRVLARNWRSPRDRRDEADLIVLSPNGREVAIVEVKRAAGPWDPLDRVDVRKREVLWRILTDIEALASARPSSSPLHRAAAHAECIRVDLVGVRGEGSTATVVEHATGIFTREFVRNARSRAP
jgi:Holliday junction resolvase-like predicted endonuclease